MSYRCMALRPVVGKNEWQPCPGTITLVVWATGLHACDRCHRTVIA